MYRVHGNDGEKYEAPSLAVLQQWVQEGRIVTSTTIEDLLGGTEGPASGIEGLSFGPAQPFAPDAVDYPRAAPGQPTGCAVHAPLVVAVACTICCLPLGTPLGVAAAIYAAKIPLILQLGDLEKAKKYTIIAYSLSGISFILGILYIFLVLKFGKALGLPMS